MTQTKTNKVVTIIVRTMCWTTEHEFSTNVCSSVEPAVMVRVRARERVRLRLRMRVSVRVRVRVGVRV